MKPNEFQKLYGFLTACCLSAAAFAQNVGIGVSNPQKGKLEIAGALGGHTTVLTAGSDGTGISLQRNWPTIGLNQYRDSANSQRFIGNGFAGSIFLSQDNGSMVFSQFGQGSANQQIQTPTYPLVIDQFGSTVANGGLVANENVYLKKELLFSNEAKVLGTTTGSINLLPYALGYVLASGAKQKGTDNFTSNYIAGLGYVINIADAIGHEPILDITVRSQTAAVPTYSRNGPGTFIIYIWNTSGQKVAADFSFTMYKL